MPFIEVFAPHGSVDPEQQNAIGDKLVAELTRVQGAPETESWLAWHDVKYWTVGGQPTNATEPARFVVRISVPVDSMDDEKRGDMVATVTNVLSTVEAKGPHRSPTAWVQLVEVADARWGVEGRVVRFAEIAGYVSAGADA
jgi:phenylpyruvate tautomerase PptA (4-oxalocrotonate tautomerase family)